jgi:predicted RND superfamily exporter protein
VQREGATPERRLILMNRNVRAIILSLAVLMGAAIAFMNWLGEPSELRRVGSVVLLIGVMACVVAVMLIDEWFAMRVQHRIETGKEVG